MNPIPAFYYRRVLSGDSDEVLDEGAGFLVTRGYGVVTVRGIKD